MRLVLFAVGGAWASVLVNGDAPRLGCLSGLEEADVGSYAVYVDNEEPNRVGWVGGCHPIGSRLARSDDEPAPRPFWYDPASVDAPCEVRAYEQRGVFAVRSAPVRVEPPVPGEVTPVVLTLPEGPTGGVGFRFQAEADGMRVVETIAGMPAHGALEPGDLIVAVDGEPTAGLTTWEFVDLSVGPVGSGVEFEVETARGTRLHYYRRTALEGLPSHREPPPPATGGVGFRLEPSADGARVYDTFSGMPADGVLAPGDLIVAVDDVPTAGLTVHEVADRITGRPGTEVTLRVETPRRTFEHTFVREWLPGR